MNPNWIFEDWYLAASNEGGRLLRRWAADEAMGQGLALILNHSNSLSSLLLWPLYTDDEQNGRTLSTQPPYRDATANQNH